MSQKFAEMTVAVFKEHLTLCCTDIDKIVVLTEKICSLKVQEAVRFNSQTDRMKLPEKEMIPQFLKGSSGHSQNNLVEFFQVNSVSNLVLLKREMLKCVSKNCP